MASTPPDLLVSIRHEGEVAVIDLDDGKANALGSDVIEALIDAFDKLEGVGSVVLAGRPERFSAGFDLNTMGSGPDAAREMLRRGVDLFLRMYLFPRPIVAACTGHALAAGAILLMCSDLRIGARGDYRIGLPEVTIGMPLPLFATELARDRISNRHYTRATSLGHIYNPETALDAGFLDEVVESARVIGTSIERAGSLTGVGSAALSATRSSTRGAIARTIQQNLDNDLSRFFIKA